MITLVVQCDRCEAVHTMAVKPGDTVPSLAHADHEPFVSATTPLPPYHWGSAGHLQGIEPRPRKPKHGRYWSAPALRKNGKPKKAKRAWYGVLTEAADQ